MSELLSGWELKKIEGAKLVASGSSCCNSSEHIVDAYGCFLFLLYVLLGFLAIVFPKRC
jgi:hypothetical protein